MLILKRKVHEGVLLDSPEGVCRVVVIDAGTGWCRLGIDAPDRVVIVRDEIASPEQAIRYAEQKAREER